MSLAGAQHYWNGSSLAGLAYQSNGDVYYQYFDPNAGATGSWSGSPINLSAIAPGGAYLQVRVSEFAFKKRDQSRERIDFSGAFDSLSITPGNAWDFLQAGRAAVPADADSLVVAFSLEAEGLDNLLQPGDLKPRAALRIAAAGDPDQELAQLTTPPLPDAGDMAKTNFRFSLPLQNLNTGEIIARLRVDHMAPKAATFASLGHIYDFTGLAVPAKSAEPEMVTETIEAKDFCIETAYPNPFNPETTIRYHLPQPARVSIRVYNILGEQIRSLLNETVSAGIHEARWDGRSDSGEPAGSGIYLLRMVATSTKGQFSDVQKIVLTR